MTSARHPVFQFLFSKEVRADVSCLNRTNCTQRVSFHRVRAVCVWLFCQCGARLSHYIETPVVFRNGPLCILLIQESTQTAGDVTLRVFDPVTVQISIDKSNIQHQKLALKLVKPVVSIRLSVVIAGVMSTSSSTC